MDRYIGTSTVPYHHATRVRYSSWRKYDSSSDTPLDREKKRKTTFHTPPWTNLQASFLDNTESTKAARRVLWTNLNEIFPRNATILAVYAPTYS